MLTDGKSTGGGTWSWARALAVLATAALLSGCGLGYLTQAARGQLRVMHARQPVDRLLASPDTTGGLRAQLEQVKRIRDFASRELGLPDNASYRSYADIKRPYVVWNVVATPEFSVQPRTWCFPVAGCVAYRGYFSEAAAEAFAATLRQRGDDVVVGGVPAYSTLGRFADPVLSTMTGYGELDLAAMIFHELAHQVAYLPGDSSFNEAFATTVEEAGLSRYAASQVREGAMSAALANRFARRAARETLSQLFVLRRRELAALYVRGGPVEEMRAAKAREFAALADAIRAFEQQSGRPSGYRSWIESGLNNAHLASIATYFEEMPYFERLLAERNGDLPGFYAAVRAVIAQRSAEAKGPRRRHSSPGPRT
ncbi:MAG: aminopeptidase [Pseudomonadota bacterium]